jgi:hypothetical protein
MAPPLEGTSNAKNEYDHILSCRLISLGTQETPLHQTSACNMYESIEKCDCNCQTRRGNCYRNLVLRDMPCNNMLPLTVEPIELHPESTRSNWSVLTVTVWTSVDGHLEMSRRFCSAKALIRSSCMSVSSSQVFSSSGYPFHLTIYWTILRLPISRTRFRTNRSTMN